MKGHFIDYKSIILQLVVRFLLTCCENECDDCTKNLIIIRINYKALNIILRIDHDNYLYQLEMFNKYLIID